MAVTTKHFPYLIFVRGSFYLASLLPFYFGFIFFPRLNILDQTATNALSIPMALIGTLGNIPSFYILERHIRKLQSHLRLKDLEVKIDSVIKTKKRLLRLYFLLVHAVIIIVVIFAIILAIVLDID